MLENDGFSSIGKYKILGILGRGSMGVVYKAEDPEIGRTVAIKTIRTVASGQPGDLDAALKRLSIEARSAGNLRHPNIITIFDISRHGTVPYIVMDFIDGVGLDTIIAKNGPLNPKYLIEILGPVASAIDHAHSKGVIHRDIKPSNIIIDKNKDAFIVDFGIAKIASSSGLTSDKVLGTPSYMSPEQILNEPLTISSDLFSFAAVAFECFSGKRPFRGDTFTEVVGNILNEKPTSIGEIVESLPLTLEAVLERGLSKNPKDRYRSASDFVSALKVCFNIDSTNAEREHDNGEEDDESNDPDQRNDHRHRRLRKPTSEDGFKRIKQRKFSKNRQEGEEKKDKTKGINLETDSNNTSNISDKQEMTKALTRVAGSGDNFTRVRSKTDNDLPQYNEVIFGRNSSIYSHYEGKVGKKDSSSFAVISRILLILAIFTVLILISLLIYQTQSAEKINPLTSPLANKLIKLDEESPMSLPDEGVTDLPSVESVPEGKKPFEMNDKQLLGVLVSAGSPDDLVVESIHEALTRRIVNLVEAVVVALQSDSYVVRIEAVKALGTIGDRRVVPNILVMLDDHDPLVRSAAAGALSKLGDRRAVPYLNSRLATEDVPEVRRSMSHAIEEINGYPSEIH